MTEWTYGRPAGWNVLGNPLMLYCTPRDGDSAVAVVYGAGCGLAQRVTLQPGKKYYYRVRTIRSAKFKVANRNDGEASFETDVNGDAAGFFMASAADAVVSIVGQDATSFELKSCAIHSTDPDPMKHRVPVPQIPVFFSGIDPNMLPALGSANLIDGYFDAATTWKLIRRGVLGLGCVSIQHGDSV